jgi:16S rRNA (uracil1498-N3)-methyltransferase
MRQVRHYVELPLHEGASFELPEVAVAHLVRVLRLGAGDRVRLFNGDGHDYEAELLQAGKRGAQARVLARVDAPATESPLAITLAQGIARGEKMDWVLQKATELGVARIAPVQTERTEVKLDPERADKRGAHWRGVIASACEQSGRARVPELLAPRALSDFLAAERSVRRLVLDPGADCTLASLQPAPGDSLCLLVGPEGGLSERDLAAARAAGFAGLRLGPRILRTETAALAAISGLHALYGDWR